MMSFGGESDIGWPEVEDLKRRLDVNDTSVHDVEMGVILAAAIDQIKHEVGEWDELTDAPNEALAEAALARAVELGSDVMPARSERKSNQLLYGQRRRFPIA
jgi:hypothetical protein